MVSLPIQALAHKNTEGQILQKTIRFATSQVVSLFHSNYHLNINDEFM